MERGPALVVAAVGGGPFGEQQTDHVGAAAARGGHVQRRPALAVAGPDAQPAVEQGLSHRGVGGVVEWRPAGLVTQIGAGAPAQQKAAAAAGLRAWKSGVRPPLSRAFTSAPLTSSSRTISVLSASMA
jgi:hypothetical protein